MTDTPPKAPLDIVPPSQDSHMNLDRKPASEFSPGDTVVLVRTVESVTRSPAGVLFTYEDGASQQFEDTAGVPTMKKVPLPGEPGNPAKVTRAKKDAKQ